jgi:molybdenum-dependent DNA-binding transcriptional regulator ModE
METLLMSNEERKRMVLLTEVKKGGLSLAEAGRTMGVSYRQAKRIWRRFQKLGDSGLVHHSRGKPGPRRKKPKFRRQVLARYQQRYPDFGPTLAAEKLQEEGLKVDHETLRRWLIEKGLWTLGRRKRRQHRAWRERRECFGQMVQLDGSHHDWFEGRRGKAVLMVMVDDATNRTVARFFEEETTEASYEVFEAWVRQYGLPQSLYVDRDSIYRCERVASVAEQIAGQEPQTQFGRAMAQLGVELILANSPQAKGRVERRNGLLQDRLVKELRLAGINDLAGADEFLEKKFLPALNMKFTVQARSAADGHRQGSGNLKEILSWEEQRVVTQDWTVCWQGRWFQIQAEHEKLSLVGRKVTVRRLRGGAVQLLSKDQKLAFKELPTRPVRVPPEPRRVGRTRLFKPKAEHPWRQDRAGVGQEFWRNEKARGRTARRARHQAAPASGQPPLRSGFPTAAAA